MINFYSGHFRTDSMIYKIYCLEIGKYWNITIQKSMSIYDPNAFKFIKGAYHLPETLTVSQILNDEPDGD